MNKLTKHALERQQDVGKFVFQLQGFVLKNIEGKSRRQCRADLLAATAIIGADLFGLAGVV